VLKEVLELMTLMLAPMAPHLAEELWEMLGHGGGLIAASWPQYRAEFAAEEQVEVVVQISGRVRWKIIVEVGLDEDALFERAMSEQKVAEAIRGKQIVKKIVVPDKLVNIVVR
jgi:leucyl-tRNA synthetase